MENTHTHYFEVLDLLPDGIQIIDFNWNFIYVNPAAESNLKKTKQQLLGHAITGLYPNIQHTAYFDALQLCMVNRTTQYHETVEENPDKSRRYFRIKIEPVEAGILVISHNATAQKEGEEETIRISRLYAFISQVNQKIVRLKDEGKLFSNACDMALEFGKFKMAWIGMFDLPNKKITLVEQCGIGLEDIDNFAKSPHPINGPQDYVLRTGKYYLCQNIQEDLGLEMWKPLVAKLSIESCIVLPIKKAGAVVGTFNIYGNQTDFSNREEIKLLEEAAGDISYALDLFENVKKHKATEERIVQNEKRFRALIEKSGDMITLSTGNGKMLYGSPSVTKLFGYTLEDIAAASISNLIHPDDMAGFLEKRDNILKTPGKSFNAQLRLRNKAGSWIWCEATVTNLLAEPSVNALITNFRDVSRKKALEKQQDFDKNNLDALINNTKDLMWSVDRNLNLITANQPFDDMLMFMSGKTISKGSPVLSGALSAEQYNHFKTLYERAFAGETFIEIEYRENPVDYWSEISYCPIRKGTEIIGAACHSHDITERKLAEKKLRLSEASLKQAQTLAHIGNWEIDLLQNKHSWSDELYNIFGIDKDEVQASTALFLSQIHPEDAAIARKNVANSLDALQPSSYNFRFITKDGSTRFGCIERKFEFDKNNIPVRVFGIIQDVTERKKAEYLLKKSEAFSRGVLNSLQSHIAVIDVNGSIVAVNEPWKKFAIENGDPSLQNTGVGCNYFDVCNASTNAGSKMAEKVLIGIKELMNEKMDSFSFEYPCHSPSEKRWFQMHVMKFDSDEPMLVVSHQNITDRKVAERERIKITNDLIQRNKDLQQFAYIVSHNLRAPVANIIGLINAINTLELEPVEEKEMIRHLDTSIKKLDEVIRDLNQTLQVRDNVLNEQKQTVRFADVLIDVQISIDLLIREEDVSMISDFADVQEMQTIKSYLFSIFLNLVTNSIKYKQPHIKPIITITSKRVGNNIELVFKDNGLGIDLEKQQERVFGLYKRFHNHIEGKGMGLYMVKSQVEMLGGKISIKSKPNQGAEFIIELPL